MPAWGELLNRTINLTFFFFIFIIFLPPWLLQMHEDQRMCCAHELWLCVGRGDGGVGGEVSQQ